MNEQIVTESFSRGYELVYGVDVLTLDDEEAIMDFEMFNSLEAQFGEPLVGYVDGLHYHFKPERSIPPSTLAVPKLNHENPETLLIQR
jgi:hypothetical protein